MQAPQLSLQAVPTVHWMLSGTMNTDIVRRSQFIWMVYLCLTVQMCHLEQDAAILMAFNPVLRIEWQLVQKNLAWTTPIWPNMLLSQVRVNYLHEQAIGSFQHGLIFNWDLCPLAGPFYFTLLGIFLCFVLPSVVCVVCVCVLIAVLAVVFWKAKSRKPGMNDGEGKGKTRCVYSATEVNLYLHKQRQI